MSCSPVQSDLAGPPRSILRSVTIETAASSSTLRGFSSTSSLPPVNPQLRPPPATSSSSNTGQLAEDFLMLERDRKVFIEIYCCVTFCLYLWENNLFCLTRQKQNKNKIVSTSHSNIWKQTGRKIFLCYFIHKVRFSGN